MGTKSIWPFYLKVPCLIIINIYSSFQFAFFIDSTIINILSKLLSFVPPSNICSTYIPCNTFNQHLGSKGATVSSDKSEIVPIMISVGMVCLVLIGGCNADLAQILPSFVKQFRAPVPLPLFYNVSKEIKASLTKKSSSLTNLSNEHVIFSVLTFSL